MDFTNAEKERINQLYGTDFKDITPEDALLIGRFEAWKATQESEHQAKMKALEDEATARMEATQAQHEQAMNNLAELHAMAIARLERIEDGI